jgi:hypothetical protein
MPIERISALDNVEKEIASCIQSAGNIKSTNLCFKTNCFIMFGIYCLYIIVY